MKTNTVAYQKISKCAIIAAILATIYLIFIIFSFSYSLSNSTSNDAEFLGNMLAVGLLTPHIILVCIGIVFNWIGVSTKKSWAILVGAILYSTSALIFLLYATFVLPSMILAFIGYSKQKAINAKVNDNINT